MRTKKPPPQRRVIQNRFGLGGRTCSQTARDLHTPQGTVKSTQNRALYLLQEAMKNSHE